MNIITNLGPGFQENRLNGIDTSRSNMKRILNPSMKFYTLENHSAAKPSAQNYGKSSAESFDARRQTGTDTGTKAAGSFAGNAVVTSSIENSSLKNDTSGRAGSYSQADEATRANISTGGQVPGRNKQVAGSNKSGFQLDFTEEGLLNGIILAEVLGKPKYLRKGRW